MKNFLLSFCLLFGTLVIGKAQPLHQDFDIQWGDPYKESRRNVLAKIAGYDQEFMYALSVRNMSLLSGNTKFTLERYNAAMNQTASVEVDLCELSNDRSLVDVTHFNGKLYLFTTEFDKDEKESRLYLHTLDKQKLQPQGEGKLIAKRGYEGWAMRNHTAYTFSSSRDSSRYLISYTLPFKKGEPEQIGFQLLDAQMNPIWKKEVSLPYQSDLFEVERIKVDNAGGVHVLGKLFDEKPLLNLGRDVPSRYKILSYRKEANELTEYTAELPEKTIVNMQLEVLPNRNLICAGFYSETGKGIRGSYFISINARTNKLIKESTREFSADFLTEDMKEGKAKRTKKKIENGKEVELISYELDELVLREDGGAVLIGEQYFVSTSRTYDGKNWHTSTMYNHNNIAVVNIDPAGEIVWAHQIIKKQRSGISFYSSYASAVIGSKLYFIYNDSRDNLKGDDKVKTVSPGRKNDVVVMVEMDEDGNQKKKPLFLNKDAGVITIPKLCSQIAPNTIIVYGQRKKDHRFAKLSFPTPNASVKKAGMKFR